MIMKVVKVWMGRILAAAAASVLLAAQAWASDPEALRRNEEIGRASCRERV